MEKRCVSWLFFIVILIALLLISVVLGITGYFSSITYLKSSTDLKVGENIVMHLQPNQSSVMSFTFDGGYLPDEKIPQNIQFVADDLNVDLMVRVKSQIFGTDQKGVITFESGRFQKSDDGYYYFDDFLKGGNKISFCSYIIMPDETVFVSGEKYVLSIVVETLNSEFGENIWRNVQQ